MCRNCTNHNYRVILDSCKAILDLSEDVKDTFDMVIGEIHGGLRYKIAVQAALEALQMEKEAQI